MTGPKSKQASPVDVLTGAFWGPLPEVGGLVDAAALARKALNALRAGGYEVNVIGRRLRTCLHCGRELPARSRAKFCQGTTRCQVAYWRAAQQNPSEPTTSDAPRHEVYCRITDQPVASTHVNEHVIIDRDTDGAMIGVEVISVMSVEIDGVPATLGDNQSGVEQLGSSQGS